MGLFGRRVSKVEKLTKKVTNPYAQSQDRIRFMEQLANSGTEEGLEGVLQRFTFRTEASITDGDEKETAYKLLVDAGPLAIGPIERFVRSHHAVYWPLKAMTQIAGMDRAVDLLLEALDEASQKDDRTNTQKVQLVSNMRDFSHPRVRERLEQLVEDPSEEVRTQAVDGLMTYGEETALEPAVQRVLDPEESPRVKTVILEQLIDLAWSLEPWRKTIEEQEALPFPYELKQDGRLTRQT